jgi:TolB-like protein
MEKERLMHAIWPGMIVEENNLSQAISNLRRVLGDDGAAHRYIVTVPRRGYRFVALVRPAAESLPADALPPSAGTDQAVATLADFPSGENLLRGDAPAQEVEVAASQTTVVGFGKRGGLLALAGLAVVLIGLLAQALWRAQPAGPVLAPVKSIVVLPFANPGGNKEDEFFGDGVTEDLLTQLAQISELRVVSRSTSMRYKGSSKSLREIARELGVSYVLEGSVRRGEGRFRINAELIDSASDGHLWARTYDRENRDILAVQSEVTTEIATALKAQLQGPERDQLARRAHGNAEAYLEYLQGMYVLRKRTTQGPERFDPAKPHFLKAIELDPASALGYVGMGSYFITRARLGFVAPAENYAQAEGFLTKALAVDSQSAEVHIRLAELRGTGQWNWADAEKLIKRAIELEPGNALAWDIYRMAYLEPTGRLVEAMAAQQRAASLDPFSATIGWRLANLYAVSGNCNEAIRLSRLNIARDPTFTIHHTVIVTCLEHQGDFAGAIAEARLVNGYWTPKPFLDALQSAFAAEGEKGYRRVKSKFQHDLATTRTDSWYYAAAAAFMAGERDEGFRRLDLAIKAVDRNVIYLKVDLDFAGVREDPRYHDALRRLHLE